MIFVKNKNLQCCLSLSTRFCHYGQFKKIFLNDIKKLLLSLLILPWPLYHLNLSVANPPLTVGLRATGASPEVQVPPESLRGECGSQRSSSPCARAVSAGSASRGLRDLMHVGSEPCKAFLNGEVVFNI